MTEERVQDFLKQIVEQVDEGEYPEICRTLSYYQDMDDHYVVEDETELADEFYHCDETKVLPPIIAEFIEEVYLEEIKDKNYAAANNLGALYYTGRIGVQDYTKAMKYYEFAAKGGERQAQENLGYCYYYGRNCEKDYKKAFHYFALGAFDGHLRSLYKIGDMYRNGYYVEKNEQEAYAIYLRCYNTLTEEAIPSVGADILMRLGDCNYDGIGTEIDYGQALHCYQQAELLFFRRLQEGDFLIKRCYEKVIARQQEAREKMKSELPAYDWTE